MTSMKLEHNNDPIKIAIVARLQGLHKEAVGHTRIREKKIVDRPQLDRNLISPYKRIEDGEDAARIIDDLGRAIAKGADPETLQILRDNYEIAANIAVPGRTYSVETIEQSERQHERDIKPEPYPKGGPHTKIDKPNADAVLNNIVSNIHGWYESNGWAGIVEYVLPLFVEVEETDVDEKNEITTVSFDIPSFSGAVKFIIDRAMADSGAAHDEDYGWFDRTKQDLKNVLEGIKSDPSKIGSTKAAEEKAAAEEAARQVGPDYSKLTGFYDAEPDKKNEVWGDVLASAEKTHAAALEASRLIGSKVASEVVERLSKAPSLDDLIASEGAIESALGEVNAVFGPAEGVSDLKKEKILVPSDNMRKVMRYVLGETDYAQSVAEYMQMRELAVQFLVDNAVSQAKSKEGRDQLRLALHESLRIFLLDHGLNRATDFQQEEIEKGASEGLYAFIDKYESNKDAAGKPAPLPLGPDGKVAEAIGKFRQNFMQSDIMSAAVWNNAYRSMSAESKKMQAKP